MSTRERKAESDMIRILWTAIKHHKTTTVPASKIIKYLMVEIGMTEVEAEELLSNAVEDGLVEASSGNNTSRNSRKSPVKGYQIPTEYGELISDLDHDLYCFECHSPKNLQKCSACPRVFHEKCMRSILANSEIQIRSSNSQHENANDSGITTTESSVINNETSSNKATTEEPSNQQIAPQSSFEQSELKPELKMENVSLSDDSKTEVMLAQTQPDVICIGEVRPPSRRKRRLISTCNKHEANLNTENDGNGENTLLCTSCRLQKNGELRDPPNIDEVNYLLKFIFGRIRSWITADTYSPLPCSSIPMPSKHEFDLFEKKCLRFPTTLENIQKKLKANCYKTLTEYQRDIMDIKHSIGILYGVNSAEYDAAGYLQRDCAFEVSEIVKCRDCYRHSNEKKSEHWFCKPCVPRHELVFAKQIGYSHWPAKVIKFENRRYDVRFFGSKHLRAVIDANNVLPIDTDIESLKIKQKAAFNKAMDELHRHQKLLQCPVGCFSFEAERTNPVDLTGLSRGIGNGRGRGPKTKKSTNNSITNDGESTMELSISTLTSATASTSALGAEDSNPETWKKPIVRLKRTMHNLSAEKSNHDSDVTPNKKARPNSSSTPLKKRVTARGKPSNSDINSSKDASKKSTSYNKSAANDNNLDMSSAQTLEEESLGQDHLGQQTSKSNPPVRVKSKIGRPKQEVVNLHRELQALKCPPTACRLATDALQTVIDRSAEHIKQLVEKHTQNISEVKKKQWCYNCEKEAIYHCCWNTAYCSTECQQEHWHVEHKKTCRRKR